MTLKQPPLADVFTRQRTLAFSSFARPSRLLLTAPASRLYLSRLASAQRLVEARVRAAVPRAAIRWHYGVVLNGFAVLLPRAQLERLSRVPGVEQVWPSISYHALLDRTPQLIGAPAVWGPELATAGQGMKIGIVDDGIEQTHPFFDPTGYAYPAGFPKGQTAYTTPKVIVARAFPPPTPKYRNASLPFDPLLSSHGTHVAGIAAGNYATTTRTGLHISGIAPRAFLGNYKALTVPSAFGPNGNGPELAAAVEMAVRDGMDVINLSLGETEIDSSRDLVARALNAAAAAGVVSTVAAGNDFGDFGFGSITSPANATRAISAAASTGGHGSVEVDTAASFSSSGPTPYSHLLKPDVTAPGVSVLSSLPPDGFGDNSGTSMAAPHVAGAVAVLRQRHPAWTPAQLKSALVQTGARVLVGDTEVSPLREGGGRIDLVLADQPLVFASPTAVTFGLLRPGARLGRNVLLTDAGGGGGTWNVSIRGGGGSVSAPSSAMVPGSLAVRAAVPSGAREADVAGFVVLTRGADVRRIPFWLRVERPRLATERRIPLTRPGDYTADTRRGVARVSSYRYPDVPPDAGFPVRLTGPELVYQVRLRRPLTNFGVAVVTRERGVSVEPRVVRNGDENRLAGYAALPIDENPYRETTGKHRLVVGVVRPAAGLYDIVFDTPRGGRAGRFTFRFWLNDTTPPAVRVLGVRNGALVLAVTDRGSAVDPVSLAARIDGSTAAVSYGSGRATVSLNGVSRGRHVLRFSAADYQETKNMENVNRILPNTRVIQQAFVAP